jgi:hypothetical protein
LIFVILALGVMTLSACGTGDDDTQMIFGGDYNLPQGKTLRGSLVMFGGSAHLEPDTTVMGDVVIMGGTLSVSGTVQGDVTSIGGTLNIEASAILEKDLNTMGGSLTNLGSVRGKVYEGTGEFSVDFVRNLNLPTVSPDPATQAMWILLRSLILAGLALLVILLLPQPADRVAQSISRSPLVAGGAGCLTLLLCPAVLIVLAITIILIPITLLGLLLLGLVLVFGWIGLGLAVGKALTNAFHLELPAPICGALGTLLISLVVDFAMFGMGFFWVLLCCAGIPFLMVVFSLAIGGVLLSQFGTRIYTYTPTRPSQPPPPVPLAPDLSAVESPAPPEPPAGPARFTPPETPRPTPWTEEKK